jgi:hypothetical protein
MASTGYAPSTARSPDLKLPSLEESTWLQGKVQYKILLPSAGSDCPVSLLMFSSQLQFLMPLQFQQAILQQVQAAMLAMQARGQATQLS